MYTGIISGLIQDYHGIKSHDPGAAACLASHGTLFAMYDYNRIHGVHQTWFNTI